MDRFAGEGSTFGEVSDGGASTVIGLRQLATGWTLALIANLLVDLAQLAIFNFYVKSGHSFTQARALYVYISFASLSASVVACWLVASGLYRIAGVAAGVRAAQIASWARGAAACFIVLMAMVTLLHVGPQALGRSWDGLLTGAQPYIGLFTLAFATAGFLLVVYMCDALVESVGSVVPSGARIGIMLVLVYRMGFAIYLAFARHPLELGLMVGYGASILETIALYGLAIWLVRDTARQLAAGREEVPWAEGQGRVSLPPPSGTSDMLIGGIMLLVGLGVTVASYTAASEGGAGGRYVVTTGAIVFGALRFFRGLSQSIKNGSRK